MRKEQAERDGVPYKLETGKMMSGLPSESFSIIVLPLGQKMDLGAITLRFICSISLFGSRQ
jgi:hypothetical protein